MAKTDNKPHALGYWTEKSVFVKACEASHHAGHHGHQAFTPWPVHGLEKKMGLRRSWIGRVVLFMLLFGALCGFLMQLYMLKYDYPINIGGKPYNSWPAFVVITFESGILCGALTNLVVCLFIACRLFPRHDTVLPNDLLTDDTFCLAIPASDEAQFAALETWLVEHGAESTGRFVPQHAEPAGDPAHA
jgi:hypothetical protein